ncbi:hypothetical protein M3Y98_00188300 [Aphelenchoides besseyi]|nr:hypothetical protein M3Y98_00188300 [Aphelenchoides besseyi]KAI6200186.1 hypothetical protein M3Y96_00706200 [Aphelenchoides besseyi]
MEISDHCPGLCGRVPINLTVQPPLFSPCGPCPWGSRNIDNSRCEECTLPLRFYDYLFLIFHAVLPLFVNGIFIKVYATSDQRTRSRTLPTKWLVSQLICAALEATLGLMTSLLIYPPYGSFKLYGCRKSRLIEWYSMLNNPVVNHTHTLRCTYEIVYPLYSLPFATYAFELAALVLFRSTLYIIARRFGRRLSSGPFYAALWTLPIMALIHSFMGGLIYYTFANLTVFSALLSNSVHLAMEGRKGVFELFKQILTNVETLTLVLVHLFLFGYGILGLYFNPPPTDWISWTILVFIIPSPVLFYVLTVRLTEPIRSRNRLGDNYFGFQNCVSNCRQLFDCPHHTAAYGWIQKTCFEHKCMWKTVAEFEQKNYQTPQFYGKWPFSAISLAIGPIVLLIQEPASTFFSLLNLCGCLWLLNELKMRTSIKASRLRDVWIGYSIVGIGSWICSMLFHSRDFWLTELLDYFAAGALIFYAFYASLIVTIPILQRRKSLRLLIFSTTFFFYCRHVYYLFSRSSFDYQYNMFCCVSLSVITAVIYILWCIKEWLVGQYRPSMKTLLITIFIGLGAAVFEVFDFPPIFFWTIDAHSLFHLATIPTPILLARFAVAEAEREVQATKWKYALGKEV